MKISISLIVVLFSFMQSLASEDSIKDVQRLSYGLSILPSISIHRAEMLPPKPMSICCPMFTDGQGIGYDASIFTKYVLDYHQSISASFGYRDIGARLSTETLSIVNAKNQAAIVRSTLESSLSVINIQFQYHLMPFHRFEITSGFILGVNASKNYTYQENILSGTIVFDNGTQQRNTSIGALTGINPRYFGLMFGASYRIPISDAVFIKPMAQFTHALRPIQFGVNWFADAITFGMGFEFFPFGEIQKPKTVRKETKEIAEEKTVLNRHTITIKSKESGNIKINQQVFYHPIPDIVYREIFEDNTLNLSNGKECLDDHGTCLYPYLLDTIAHRMNINSASELRIQMSAQNMNLQNIVLSEAARKGIDTSKIYIDFAKDIDQGITKILSTNLIRPFEIIRLDSIVTHPAIRFILNSEINQEFEWGVYDFQSGSVIKKGKGISNEIQLIDSIPIDWTKGILRCLVNEQGKKSIIQTEIQLDSPAKELLQPIPCEIAALFALNSDSLRQVDIESIKGFERMIQAEDSIIIEAFTDLSGDSTLNSDLARRRADAVAQYFPKYHKQIILSPLKARNAGKSDYQKAYNRIVTIKRKQP